MVRSMYTSANMEKDISITSDPVDRFQGVWGHFGVVFQGKSSSVVCSEDNTNIKIVTNVFANFQVQEPVVT